MHISDWTGICCKRYDDDTLQCCIVTLLSCCTGYSQNPGFPMPDLATKALATDMAWPITASVPKHTLSSLFHLFIFHLHVSSRLLLACPLCSRVNQSEQVVEDEVAPLSVGKKLEGLRIAHRSLLCFDLQPRSASVQHRATRPHDSCLYSPTMLRSRPPGFHHLYCSAAHRSC